MSSSPSTAPSRPVEGVEVPIPGSDNLKWIELTVPPPPSVSTPSPPPPPPPPPPQAPAASPRSRSTGSCHVVPGDPPAYLIWRIHEDHPNVLEIIELFPSREFPKKGLHLVFPDAIFPFSFICKNEAGSTSANAYMIYALTVSGFAYLFKLRSFYAYTSGSIFPGSDVEALNVQTLSRITAVEATFGYLMIGREDGSVSCYQLGTIDEVAPGFMLEFRDDVGIGRLWNLMSRGRVVAAVLDLVVHELFGRKFLFVAYMDGSLRVWDLLSNTKILYHSMSKETTGSLCRFWVSDANYNTCQFLLVVQHEGHLESNFGMIAVYTLNFNGEKLTVSLEPSVQYIPLDEGRLVDMKLSHDKIWLLKEEGPMLYNLSYSDTNMENECVYNLHEEYIADQLFQGSEHLSDDLIWTNLSAYSSTKDQIPYVISSIFLRRLLQPGISLSSALYATILDQKRYMADYEMQSLTISSLKQELLSIIESEGVATNLRSVVYYWKKFSSHFFHYWCQNNAPYGLFVDPLSGGVGLIRKSSISLFRQLENIETVVYGSYDESHDIRNSGLLLPGDDLDCEILFDVLRSMSIIRHQLGRASSSVFYESLANPSIVSYEDTVFRLLKVLEAGYSSSLTASLSSQVGDDTTWELKQTDHRNHRKFSIDMLLSLSGLHNKATTWGRVLDIIELHLKNLLPDKLSKHIGSKKFFSINSSLLVQATSQIAGVMFDCAFDMHMLLGYLANVNVQVQMVQTDLSRIRLKIIPMIENIIMHWHILHFIAITQTEAVTMEDFSSRLSSLHIDKSTNNRSWDGKLGTSGFTLACLLNFPIFPNEDGFITSTSFLNPSKFVDPVWNFCSWAIWGKTDDEPIVLHPSLEMACLFLQHGQYESAENLLLVIDAHLSKNMSFQDIMGDWCACLHLLGFCLVVRGQDALSTVLKERKIREAVRCFFRAASGEGTSVGIQKLSFQTGFHCPGNSSSAIVWKFFYYQWVMQFFEQYNLSEAACQFALSALEQVDDVLEDESTGSSTLLESPDTIKGRLWANIFKFAIDLGYYRDAYCSVISNPDEDSKYICLRRFIIVLYEQGESKVLCNGELPFVGLVEKVEQELVWKAERSDISSSPNLYKLLYAFQMYRNSWRKAASYMHHYSNRLKEEVILNENRQVSSAFQEILCALSASINALQLVHPPHAWIDSQPDNYFHRDKSSPNKRPRQAFIENSSVTVDPESQRPHCYVNIETLEKEYVLISAQYLLSVMNIKSTITGNETHIVTTVDALIEANLYDMAFTLLLKFWKGSKLKRELERVFVAMSQKCCVNSGNSLFMGSDMARDIILTSDDGTPINGKADISPTTLQPLGCSHWEMLENYLEKYKKLHPRLPVTVAETLLYTDPQIELPLWLIHIFKGGRRATSWGMAGRESDPSTLFRLYVDYGRYAGATNLLLEYLEAFASMRPADIINRKKMSAVCFPYVAIERLWCHLEEVQSSGHMVDQCDRLKDLLGGAMRNHLKQVKVDSDDALASAAV